MCPRVKRYKGKEMGTVLGTEKGQKTCLEGDTDGEGKVKKALETSAPRGLKTQGLHLGLLVDAVLSGVTEPILEATSFGRQRPDQALPGGECFRLEAEGIVL